MKRSVEKGVMLCREGEAGAAGVMLCREGDALQGGGCSAGKGMLCREENALSISMHCSPNLLLVAGICSCSSV